MGAKGLWDVLKQHSRTASLTELSISEGVLDNAGMIRGLRVEVDASIWIYAACYDAQHTRNAALASLFVRVMRLLSQTAVIPLFVFDGPERPGIKRRKKVRTANHWVFRDFKVILAAAGYEWIVAPGEAEAELAWLCRERYIDYVLTEDIDVAVFGAPHILRILEQTDKDITVSVYRNIGPSVNELVLVALFEGGDYGAGLSGCDIQTAKVLARLEICKQLVSTVLNMAEKNVAKYLQSWRTQFIAHIREHSSKTVRTLLIPADFPPAHILLFYLRPKTSMPAMPILLSWDSAPDLRKLASFASHNLDSCNSLRKLMEHFSKIILPGLAIRDLLKTQLERDNMLDFDICPYRVIGPPVPPRANQIHRQRTHIYLELHIPSSIVFDILTGGVDGGIRQDIRPLIKDPAMRRVKAWIPRPLYELIMQPPVQPCRNKIGHRVETRRDSIGEEILELVTDSEGDY